MYQNQTYTSCTGTYIKQINCVWTSSSQCLCCCSHFEVVGIYFLSPLIVSRDLLLLFVHTWPDLLVCFCTLCVFCCCFVVALPCEFRCTVACCQLIIVAVWCKSFCCFSPHFLNLDYHIYTANVVNSRVECVWYCLHLIVLCSIEIHVKDWIMRLGTLCMSGLT